MPEPTDPIREIIEDYFDLALDVADPEALPEPEDLWRLHRDLKQAYQRLDAKARRWPEPIGPAPDPEPIVRIAIRDPEDPADEPEIHCFRVDRADAELLIEAYHDQPYQEGRTPYFTYVEIVPEHRLIAAGVDIEDDTVVEHGDWWSIRYDLALCEM